MKRLMIKMIRFYQKYISVLISSKLSLLSQPALIMPSRPSKHMVLLKVAI